jgi:hypothetical protein
MLGIVLLATLFLATALRPGYTLLPLGVESGIAPWHKQVTQQAQNPLLSDPFYTFYPRRHFFTASLQQGTYPLWNPYIFGGHPVMGDTAAQTFYPPSALAAVFLSAARALPVLAWFHLALTGVSMFVFMRLLSLRHYPALFGAVAWMLNGNTVVWLENPHRLSTLAWLPALFLFVELALRRRRLWPGIVAGGVYGLSILGGHTQFALGNGIALAAYALFRAITFSWQERRPVWRPLAVASMVGLFGIGLGAVQLLPAYQLAQLSHRGVTGVSTFIARRWPLQHVIGLWIPDFYGNPVRARYRGALNYAEVTFYYGAFAFPLALAALTWTRRAAGRFFVGMFFPVMHVVVLLIALGTPLAYLLAWLPWARYFRLVSLAAYIPFFGSAAAAFGLDALLRMTRQRRSVIWEALVTALALLMGFTVLIVLNQRVEITDRWPDISPHVWRTGLIWLSGIGCLLLMRWRSNLAVALLILLLAVDLAEWGIPFNPVNPLEILYPENEVTNLLQQDTTLFRVLPLQTDRVIFGPNVLSVLGLAETGGYSSLMVERYRELVKAIDDEVAIWWMRPNRNILVNSSFDPLFSLLNVKYVLATHPLDEHLTSVEIARQPIANSGLPLTAGERVTERFLARHPGLNRVDIELARTDGAPPDSVRFFLWRDQEGGELVADITVDGKDLPDQGVYPFFFAPVADSAGQAFVWALEAPEAGNRATVRIRQAEGDAPGGPAFTAYSTQLQLADIRQGVWIYENPNALPRAYVVHRWEVLSGNRLLDRLTSPDFNPWTTALLEEELPAEAAAALDDAPLRSSSVARITQYRPQQVEVETEMTAPGLLVLSDTHYPGWRVSVDGAPARLMRVNHTLRGVFLPEGAHEVVFRFAPQILYVGLSLTATALLGGMGAIWWEIRHSVRTRSADE